MIDERYKDLPEGCHPPLPPYKGAIFLREGSSEAKCLTHWNDIHEYLDQLPMRAIPGQKALIADDHTVWVWRNELWTELMDESAHVKSCIKRGSFSALDINYIDVPNPSEEAGIVYGGENRREWTLGNWIAHLGGRINDKGYLEFGSVYAFNMMLLQMIRADFKGKGDNMRVTVDGGSDDMKVAVASLLIGTVDDSNCKAGPNLTALVDKVNARSTDLVSIDRLKNSIMHTDITIDVLPPLRR